MRHNRQEVIQHRNREFELLDPLVANRRRRSQSALEITRFEQLPLRR